MEEFKSSFNQIGGELDILRELELPFDDLPLPDHEPETVSAPASGENSDDAFLLDEFPDGEPDQSFAGSEFPGSVPAKPDAESPGADFNFGDLGDLLGGMDNQIPGLSGTEDFTEAEAGDTGEPAAPSQEDIDFGTFIDTIPDTFAPADDTGNPPEAEVPDDFVLPAGDNLDLDNFSLDGKTLSGDGEAGPEEPAVPAGLLDGFADEIEAERASFEDEAPAGDMDPDSVLPAENFGEEDIDGVLEADAGPAETGDDLDALSNFPDFDSGESLELAGEEALPPTEIAGEPGEFSLPEELPDFDSGESFDLPGEEPLPQTGNAGVTGEPGESSLSEELPDFDSGEALDLLGEGSLPEAGNAGDLEEFSLPEELPGFDNTRDETQTENFGIGDAGLEAVTGDGEAEPADDEDSFDLGGELQNFDSSAVLEEIPGDSFDNFKVDAETLAADFDLGGEDAGSFEELEEFNLSGIDNVPAGRSAPSGGVSPGAEAARSYAEDTDEVEEIRLSDDDLESLETTLSSYPLNLRIACEELIAEQAVAPDQMSRLVKLLVDGASARETAGLAGKILGRTIPVPKGFEKRTGEALEVEQGSFAYIFVHNFLPVLRLFMMIAAAVVSTGYLCWRFVYTPIRAENIYKLGYERIEAGEYARANERFREAFNIHEKKSWFYEYARAFREARQYTLAEEKYQELLYYTASKNKRGIPEKSAVLEFAKMETESIGNYEMADRILRRNILDYYPMDPDGLLALGDNSLAWGEYEPSRLEDARESYAKIMERYGRSDPLLERMLKYFIRTDNLEETLALHSYFMASDKTKISAPALAELGGYFLDKRFEKVRGVPNEYLDRIAGIREILFRAIEEDSMLPESYYHLARYYEFFENDNDEKLTLDLAVKVFEAAGEESPRRIKYHINTLRRYGEVLVNSSEFFPAEETLVKAANLYQDALSRRLITSTPEFGKIFTDLGDLEYFVKDEDMESALDYYRLGEQNGWAPPEIQYRMGAAYYQLREWGPALDRIFTAYREMPPNRRILYALGNVSYMRGNYFAAQGYYDRLLEILNADRERLPPIQPTDDEKQLDLAERLMIAQNNLGVTLDALTERTGNNRYRSRAQGLYADSERAWDVLTRNPRSMLRMRPSPEISAPGVNPAYLNVQNSLHPVSGYEPQFFLRIDRDINEPSVWEDLAPPGYHLSEGIQTGR